QDDVYISKGSWNRRWIMPNRFERRRACQDAPASFGGQEDRVAGGLSGRSGVAGLGREGGHWRNPGRGRTDFEGIFRSRYRSENAVELRVENCQRNDRYLERSRWLVRTGG